MTFSPTPWRRGLLTLTVCAGLAGLFTTACSSAPPPRTDVPTLSASELDGARRAASSPQATDLAHAHVGRDAEYRVTGPEIAVQRINPAWLAGDDAVPALQPLYVAVDATVGGEPVTVITTEASGAWHVERISSGQPESELGGHLGTDERLVLDPARNAWFVWSGQRVKQVRASFPLADSDAWMRTDHLRELYRQAGPGH